MASPHHGQNSPPPPPQMPAIDRLSELPDSVLTHLLSFLPDTKMCVSTSILSRRWRYLWQYVPVIRLYHPKQPTAISRFMSLHKVQRIDDFRLFIRNAYSDSRQIEEWIIAAIERKVRQLHLSFYVRFVLPPTLFTCESLVDLSLQSCDGVRTDLYNVRLPRLKILHLSNCRFDAADPLTRLLSACPVLEELEIEGIVRKDDLVHCNISSPTLKVLELWYHRRFDRRDDYRVELNTPALERLRLFNLVFERIQSGPLPSLIKTKIGFYNYGLDKDDAIPYYTSALKSVYMLNHVKSLKICFSCISQDVCLQEIDSLLAGWAVSFDNLTKLTLFARRRFLPKFLKSANNLQFLHFREREVRECWREMEVESWIEPDSIPTCLVSHLRTIILGGLYSAHNELEMIRYLLKNAQVLETMEISFFLDEKHPECENKKAEMIEEISQFERGSATCELICSHEVSLYV